MISTKAGVLVAVAVIAVGLLQRNTVGDIQEQLRYSLLSDTTNWADAQKLITRQQDNGANVVRINIQPNYDSVGSIISLKYTRPFDDKIDKMRIVVPDIAAKDASVYMGGLVRSADGEVYYRESKDQKWQKKRGPETRSL